MTVRDARLFCDDDGCWRSAVPGSPYCDRHRGQPVVVEECACGGWWGYRLDDEDESWLSAWAIEWHEGPGHAILAREISA